MAPLTLSKILQSWKRFIARNANLILGRTKREFWQPESFDLWVRNDEEMARVCAYIRKNPVKAGLCAMEGDWKWGSASTVSAEGRLQIGGTAD
jgi:putative transposase